MSRPDEADDVDDFDDLGPPPRAPAGWGKGRIVQIVIMVVLALVILTVLARIYFKLEDMADKVRG